MGVARDVDRARVLLDHLVQGQEQFRAGQGDSTAGQVPGANAAKIVRGLHNVV